MLPEIHVAKICYLCKTIQSDSDKTFSPLNLGKDGIVIPLGMKSNDIICNSCYHKELAQYQKSSIKVGENVRGVTIHDKALSPEEIKAIYEKGPPPFDDKEPHIISHKDENNDYLWIDGTRVKKDKEGKK